MQRLHQPNTTDHGQQTTHQRRGFTLVELLMVILIIAGLIAILVPVVTNSMTGAREAQVVAEIKSLEGALADFKATFGKYPPSQITLFELAEDPATTAAESWDNAPRSKAIIRSLWPQFNFAMGRDINQDGNIGGQYTLEGPECLVFFLGGRLQPDDTTSPTPALSTTKALIGFSKNPANPFDVAGTNRLGPFFEFQIDRLVDLTSPVNNFYEYKDPLPGQAYPYIYLSSYDGSGYRTVEATSAGLDIDYYRQGTATGPGWKNKTFQIISPGYDGDPGDGGLFDPGNTGSLSTADEDNITNFHNGPLGG